MHHLSTLTEDSSLKLHVDVRQHLKGYLLKWKQPRMLIGCAMYVETLKLVSLLSSTLQKNIVTSTENTLKSVKALKSLSELAPFEWPTVKLVKRS